MIDNLNGDGISGQIDLVGATVNPVRLVWAGGSASLAGVCLTAGGPAYTLKVAPFPTVITREPLGPAEALGAHGYLHSCCILTAGIVGWSSRWTLAGAGTVVWWRLGGIRRRRQRLGDRNQMGPKCCR